MKLPKRNCVFVIPSSAVGHDLIFRHYTNKVVVGTYQSKDRKVEPKRRKP